MKDHWKHLAMCSPMLVIAVVLLDGGASVIAAIVPLLGCVLMMWLMMRMMSHGHAHDQSGTRR
jgi:hypothetical protein